MVMQAGKLVEVIDNRDETYRITHPYTEQLFASLPVTHPDKRELITLKKNYPRTLSNNCVRGLNIASMAFVGLGSSISKT